MVEFGICHLPFNEGALFVESVADFGGVQLTHIVFPECRRERCRHARRLADGTERCHHTVAGMGFVRAANAARSHEQVAEAFCPDAAVRYVVVARWGNHLQPRATAGRIVDIDHVSAGGNHVVELCRAQTVLGGKNVIADHPAALAHAHLGGDEINPRVGEGRVAFQCSDQLIDLPLPFPFGVFHGAGFGGIHSQHPRIVEEKGFPVGIWQPKDFVLGDVNLASSLGFAINHADSVVERDHLGPIRQTIRWVVHTSLGEINV